MGTGPASGRRDGLHFHDLRHSGNTLAATAGASLRELMDRMGHDSERATLIYLNPRVLHLPGEKPQVTWSAQAPNWFGRPTAQAC